MDLTQAGEILFFSLYQGSIFALGTIGFSLSYSVLKFPNIAQVAYISFGGFLGYTISSTLNLGFFVALGVVFLLSGSLGVASYLVVFRPLERKARGFVALTVASVGFEIFLNYAFQQVWGRNLLIYTENFDLYHFGRLTVSSLWLISIVSTLVLVLLFYLLLSKTRFGTAMRATTSNPDLVRSSGIRVTRIIYFVWFVGSAIAGLSGVFFAAQAGATPGLGPNLLVIIISVAIFAGLGSFYGVILAAFILSLAENVSIPLLLTFGLPTFYNVAVAYIIVIITLLYFPSGLTGSGPKFALIRRMRKN